MEIDNDQSSLTQAPGLGIGVTIEAKLELRTVRTDDGRNLDALVARQRCSNPHTALIYLHGKGGNFYGLPFRPISRDLDVPDALHYALNMRCHDLAYSRTDVPAADFAAGEDLGVDGGFWEDVEIGHVDVRAAVADCRAMGCNKIVLIGHSSGGYYAMDYAYRHRDVDGLVLLSPLLANAMALNVWFPDPAERADAYERAKSMVAAGDDGGIIPLRVWYRGISARSLVERFEEPSGIWQKFQRKVTAPCLYVYGGLESRAAIWQECAQQQVAAEAIQIDGADHHYIGFEAEVVSAVGDFVERL